MAVPSVLASSVCCSLQCLISTLTQGGRWWTLFFRLTCSVTLWGGRNVANNTGMCSQCLIHSGPAPLMMLTAQALGCSAGNSLRLALGFMHLLDLSCSGSGTCVVLRGQTWLGLRFVPFPGPSSSGVWRAQSLRLIASPIAAAQFSGCTTGTPSQADGDHPEPQEVLVSKEACLQFGS